MFAHFAPQPSTTEATLNWSSRVELDPTLLEGLERRQAEMIGQIDAAAEAAKLGAQRAVRESAQASVDTLQKLQRTEALYLYPIIIRYLDDREVADAFTRVRFEVYGYGRRFLRIVEDVLGAVDGESMPASNLMVAASVLRRYVAEKHARIYPLYRAVQERGGV